MQTIQYNNDTAQTTRLSARGDMSEMEGETNRNEWLRKVERLWRSGCLPSFRDVEVTAELSEYFGDLAITLEGFSVGHSLVRLPARILLAGFRGPLQIFVQHKKFIAGLCFALARATGSVLEDRIKSVIPVVSLGYLGQIFFTVKQIQVESLEFVKREVLYQLGSHVHTLNSRVAIVASPV